MYFIESLNFETYFKPSLCHISKTVENASLKYNM